jgi:hypothetical protein
MADDAQPAEGNGTPAPDGDATAAHVAAVAAAEALLKGEGHEVLNSADFHTLKTAEREKAEAQRDEALAKLEVEQSERIKLADYKARIENEGKSESELHALQRTEWKLRDDEAAKALTASENRSKELHERLANERVQNRIISLMPNTTNTEASLMWAQKHIGEKLSTDDSGQLVWTDKAGTPHVGINASNKFTAWWGEDGQKFLHAGNVPGPVTGGAPAAPTPKSDKYVNNPEMSFDENLRAADRWDATHPPK